ncbi:hypothetical protein GGS20DRAFT_535448 [Poronia punctata]|nr:hypothetical protein GGS20DRAFT_535448 [Poronia punctata]
MKSRFGMGPCAPPAGHVVISTSAKSPGAAANRLLALLVSCASFFVPVAAQTLPYIPTNIFLPSLKPGETDSDGTGHLAYIFSPQDDNVNLLALNISATLEASSLSLETLSSGLPFFENSSTAFVPSLADNGSLIVYAGDCSTSTGSNIWSFNPLVSDPSASSWNQEDIQRSDDGEWIQMGPGFLGSGFSFSTTIEPNTSPAKTFVYGGMCPNNASDPSTAQSKATYSNQMVKISPSASGDRTYTVETVDIKGPPVPEAGFTFTGLTPSFSNRSGVITQQINYVLLGGHTQYAFINMSTVAIWSLPEENWNFVSDIGIANPDSPATELTARRTFDSVDSRSGHTAVLNDDGTALVVFGGWVGDLSLAATPQLAILQIGSDYGGQDEWKWYIPDSQPPGDGIYGHGAVLLPGNVMMIHGGYSISSSGNDMKRRGSGSGTSFLNLTSMTWSDGYANPSYNEYPMQGNEPNKDGNKNHKLGLGLVHRRRQTAGRDAAIRELAQDNSRFLGHDDIGPEFDNGWYVGGSDPYARGGRTLGYQSLQAGRASMDSSRHNWFGDIPPPMQQINRKPVPPRAARGQHQEQGANQRMMNPIIEADEDDAGDGDIGQEAMSPFRDERRDSGAYSDPFQTPTHERERPLSFPSARREAQTPSPDERNRGPTTDPEVQDWISDMDAADALLSGRGPSAPRSIAATGERTSPSRRGFSGMDDDSRTGSNVSESNRSNLTPSRQGSLLRHLRPGFGVAVAAALAATTEGREGSSSSSSAPSYNTARSSFPALQAEGPGLLLGTDRERGDADEELQEPGSPSKNKPRRSWLGSLRRVFTGPDPNPSPHGSMEEDGVYHGGVAEANDFEARLGSLGGVGGIAADGLLKRKSGRRAWEPQEAGSSQDATRYSQLRADAGHEEEEWDIEKAVEKRLVQVMFTVPKERLRVVNADFESERSVVLVDPEGEKGPGHGLVMEGAEKSGPSLPPVLPPILASRHLDVEDSQRTSGSGPGSPDAEKEALRRELDAEWERIEADETLREARHSALSQVPPRSLQPPPLLYYDHHQPSSKPERSNPSPTAALEEEIHKLGLELQRTRSDAHTPMSQFSQFSHHSDGDVFSAEAVRFKRPSGSTSTLQITPPSTSPKGKAVATVNPKSIATSTSTGEPTTSTSARNDGGSLGVNILPAIPRAKLKAKMKSRSGSDLNRSLIRGPDVDVDSDLDLNLGKSTDFRSESNLRASNMLGGYGSSTRGGAGIGSGSGAGSGHNTPSRRVLAMVEEFESKSSREATPSASPTRGSPTRER